VGRDAKGHLDTDLPALGINDAPDEVERSE
jgi:hypothetical protein